MPTCIEDKISGNGTSTIISPDILSEVGPNDFTGAYIAKYMPSTRVRISLPVLLSWACGLNGQTLAFNAEDFIKKMPKSEVKEKNQKTIALLEEWFSKPDDLGPRFWEKFDKDLESNRFTI